jgi:DNA-binding transcriptional ArsR family regulator
MADIFEAISDPSRRQLLEFLASELHANSPGELSVSELVAKTKLGQPTVSKHLKVLREAELVAVRQIGQKSMYRLTPAALGSVQEWVSEMVAGADGGAIPDWLSIRLAAAGGWISNRVQLDTDSRSLGLALGRKLAEARNEAANGTKDFTALAKSRIDEFLAELRKDDPDEGIPR